ncbi:pimeloyl-ACP methyl ester carboxylesterase [Thermocatellispora tengchongensis]|uniref:Pimeloyl-ACP methyl ester carboxylesterase n=1 Tax=Thermocatellispora tengchongensis TaxID=1073253 RepID=A0A840P5K4_9ACTN|nr:hypothetical protein [Thermocatellispora tengchongensis]MBB5133836.1 pimeloyl-ACP methyl ester carboxylesterase [Thermocatellispora tengchongensis]
MSTAGREVHLVARPTGMPSPENFSIVEVDVPDPGPGEVLVRNDWMSVDQSMRGRMRDVPSYLPPFTLNAPMEGAAVGTVVASRTEALRPGDTVWHHLGWRDYTLVKAEETHRLDTAGVNSSEYLGVLGMPGLTAYLALTEIAPVRQYAVPAPVPPTQIIRAPGRAVLPAQVPRARSPEEMLMRDVGRSLAAILNDRYDLRETSLFVTGGADPVTTFMRVHTGARAFENLSTLVVHGAGHWVHQQAPDRVNQALLAHLRRVDGSLGSPDLPSARALPAHLGHVS